MFYSLNCFSINSLKSIFAFASVTLQAKTAEPAGHSPPLKTWFQLPGIFRTNLSPHMQSMEQIDRSIQWVFNAKN